MYVKVTNDMILHDTSHIACISRSRSHEHSLVWSQHGLKNAQLRFQQFLWDTITPFTKIFRNIMSYSIFINFIFYFFINEQFFSYLVAY